MRAWRTLLGVLLGATLAACGDGVLIVSVNSGVIVGDPLCSGGGGQFDMRSQGGLRVLVVITSETRIFVSGGGTGTCADLAADAAVRVSGERQGDEIIAGSIRVT